ncbi:hypothetical protein B9G54_01575 [Alloscardovia macacae]|uniref:Uncharacterized protein n=1 Tax=Alloscardovia macacae TaxID=1160091 RepID=A0A1Y2SVP1_9BIFI|nr:hypothetical protein [Alloscardovia macacae]OTA27236.1 hypothetical protein B9G54_01575 [Alloscardovia macacae]OTA29246.1 hypothetical protein B9T39_03770 [Alloscardovia macacae]
MDYTDAFAAIHRLFPDGVLVSLSESELCWAFGVADSVETYVEGSPGNAVYAVDRKTGEVSLLVPGSDVFLKYMPGLKKIPIPD